MKMDRQGMHVLIILLILGIGLEVAKPEERRGKQTKITAAEPVSEANVLAENKAFQKEKRSEPKKIALTFDDGPHPVYTQQMLELLEEEQVPATFFLLGQNVEEHGAVVKEIADRGHLIGNHTYHHVQITTLPQEQACEEIQRTNQLIEELTGQETEYVRPPFGTWSDELEDELDMIPVMWTIDTPEKMI